VTPGGGLGLGERALLQSVRLRTDHGHRHEAVQVDLIPVDDWGGTEGVNRQPQAGRREGQARIPAQALSGTEAHTRLNGSAAASQVDLAASLTGYPYSTRCSATGRRRQGCRPSLFAACGLAGWRRRIALSGVLVNHARQAGP
jgi:hypothetical protein